MVGIALDYYFYQQSYLSLKIKNEVKFCVHISPVFSCPVTYIAICVTIYIRSYMCSYYNSCSITI